MVRREQQERKTKMPKANGINLTATERQHLADAFDAIMGVASEFGLTLLQARPTAQRMLFV